MSVLLVRVIPCHMEWTEPPAGFTWGLWGCSRTFQAQRLGWGACGGQADGMGSGAGPWRLEGVLGEGFQPCGECGGRAWRPVCPG